MTYPSKNHDIAEVIRKAEVMIKMGVKFRQVWSCDECGTRQATQRVNSFASVGFCETCGGRTEIRYCNLIPVIARSMTPKEIEMMNSLMEYLFETTH